MRRTFLLPALLGLLLLPSIAHAYDWTSPATACVAGKGDNSKIQYSSTSLNNESSTASAKVFCPFPYEVDSYFRDASNLFEPIVRVFLTYVDKNSSSNITCTLVTTFADGAPILSIPQTSSSSSSTAKTFDWSFDLASFLDGGGRVAGISCTLPLAASSTSRSGIRSYRFRVE
jgi:hypothetical protein